jgi:hypothetical protein
MDLSSKNSRADAGRERIMAQQASGQSVRAWCRENAACAEHSFYWWRARLKLQPDSARGRRVAKAPVPAAGGQTIPFAEVLIGAAAGPICRRQAGGRELLLPSSMAMEQVAR